MADRTSTITLRVADAFSGPLRQLNRGLDDAGRALGNLERAGQSLDHLGRRMSLMVTAPLVGLGILATKTAIDFESAFAGVEKTVDGTAAQLADLRKEIIGLSREIPVSAGGLAKLGEVGGQLGVPIEKMGKFIDVTAKMGTATNMSAEAAADGMARFSNVMGTNLNDIDRLGSSIVSLGNQFAGTESEILGMAQRLSGAGRQIHLTEGDVLGIGTALVSVGIEAEAGGTAFSRVMIDMAQAVAQPGKRLEQFAEVAGMSAQEFADAFATTPAAAINAFVTGLGEISAAGGNVFQILESMELGDIRVRDALLRASAAAGLMDSAIQEGNRSFAENNALNAEAAKRFATTESKMRLLKNAIDETFIQILDPILPRLKIGIDGFRDAILGLTEDGRSNLMLLAAVMAAGGPLMLVIGGTISAIRQIGVAFRVLRLAAVAELAIIAGLLFTVKASWDLAMANIGKGDFHFVTPGEIMAEAGRQAGEVLGGATAGLQGGVQSQIDRLFPTVERLQTKLEDLKHESAIIGEAMFAGQVVPNGIATLERLQTEIAETEQQLRKLPSALGGEDGVLGHALKPLAAVPPKLREGAVNMGLFGGAANAAGGAAQAAADDVDALRQAMSSLGDIILPEINPAIGSLRGQITGLESGLEGVRAAMRANAAATRDAQEALRKLQETHSRLNQELGEAKSRLQDLASPRLAGQGAFEESQFQIEQQLKRLRLAEITGKPVAGTPSQFAGMTREQLEQLREAGDLQRSLQVDPLMRQIQAAAAPPKGEVSFEQAMAQITQTKAQIATLETSLKANEAAIRAQEDVIRALQAAGQALSDQMESLSAALDKARKAEQLSIDVTKTAIETWPKLRAELIKAGLISEEQAKIIDEAVRTMLEKSMTFMTGVTDEALKDLERAEKAYKELIGRMVTASNTFADAFGNARDAAADADAQLTGGVVQSVPVPFRATGGMTMVGELGPELVHLPGGSRVVNAADTAMLTRAGRSGPGPEVHLHVGAMMGSDREAQEFARLLHGYLRRERDWS